MVIDFKGDRIMDYQVWYLPSDNDKFDGYMKIPLTQAGRNTTACVEWLVRQQIYIVLCKYTKCNETENVTKFSFSLLFL